MNTKLLKAGIFLSHEEDCKDIGPILDQVEEAIRDRQRLKLTLSDHSVHEVLPWKVVFLEGTLSLVAEDAHAFRPLSFKFVEIEGVDKTTGPHEFHSSQYDREELIHALRDMIDQEVRLVLKIKSPEHFKLNPDYQFLGKPCFITNPDGDLIWAAWVEPCEALYQWLDSMQFFVEVLDPEDFMRSFEEYREAKQRKIA